MPKKGGVFTPQERGFIAHYAAHGDTTQAGIAAGIAQPEKNSSRYLARPAIQSEVVKIQLERLTNELLPLSLDTIQSILTNERAPAGARVQAAKIVLDRTLGTDLGEAKQPHEMTADEIAKAIEKLKRQASERATVIIDHEPASVFE